MKAYGVGKVQCEQYLAGLFEDRRSRTTVLRVTHTIGPRSPLASREPIFFAPPRAGPAHPRPGEGFPFVHLVHVRRRGRR